MDLVWNEYACEITTIVLRPVFSLTPADCCFHYRNIAFTKLSEQKHTELKALGPVEKTCDEPKQIGELLKQATVIEMNKRMSG